MDLLNDILKIQKLAREDKIQSFQSMFTEEPVAVKAAHAKAQQVQELEDLKVKQEKELESLKDKHERSNEKLGLEKEKESENIAIQKQRDADRKANESVELEEQEIEESLSSFLATAMPVFIGVNFMALIGLMAYEGIRIGGEVTSGRHKRTSRGRDGLIPTSLERKFNELKAKLKNKNYKPSKEDIENAKDIGKEVKKKDPSAYKKAEQQVNKLK